VVPFGAADVVRRSLERISAMRAASFVTVLKRFGEGDPGSRIPAGLMPRMYLRLEEFRQLRAQIDPSGLFASDLSRRLGL
jgi:decaprenylphospho-beta-D-ribofuranose 2-oxidase